SPEDVASILEFNYLQSWAVLESDVESFREKLQSGEVDTNYQSGGWLLTSSWHQEEPYNDQCPNRGCIWLCNSNNNSLVGCVATAGAQIMRYWNWPPYGVGSPYNDPYDWHNMPDQLTGCTWPWVQVGAVAELCHEVGVAVGMNYGCTGSSADTYDMEGVYENNYRYSTACVKRDRSAYTNVSWFNRIKAQLDLNRPVHYRIYEHSIVGDGWRERIVSGQTVREYHMNYGWSNVSYNTWYVLDGLYYPAGGSINDEYMLENIYPAVALGNSIAGTYSLQSFPYHYFDQDATGNSATFEAGQYLQFLPNVEVTCTSTTGGSIRFLGTSSYNTRLFTRGDPSKGIRIYNGAVKLNKDGSIKFP
ncbi:MAG: hypothetical protein EFT35_03420, partial [Methanophagales archaeon ANME-1-THS]